MTTLFLLISLLIFLIHLPFALIIILLSLISKLSKNIEINYNISGFYKISNLEIRISDSNKTIILFFKNIGFELIWFRIRIQIKNLNVIGNMESIEDKELNDLIKMVMTKIQTNGIPFVDLQNNSNFVRKKNKYFEKIVSLLDNYTNYDKKEKDFNEIEKLEDINKNQPKITLKEKIITQLIILFDIIIVHSEVYFELSRSKCSYLIQLEKLHFGGLKGQNRLNDYNFYGFLNEVNLFEYKALNIEQDPKLKRSNNENLREALFFDEEKLKFPLSKKSSLDLNDSQQKIEDPFQKLMHKLEENMHRIHLINFKQLVFKISFYNGFVFLKENKSPNSNSMGTKIEINNLNLNLSTKSIKTLIKNIIQLILIGKRDEIIKHKIDQVILDEVIPIEKLVYKEMLSNMKKFKLVIKNINVNFKAKNNLSTDFIIRIHKFSFLNLINLIYTIDPLNQKLVNNSIDLRFQDICILADENSHILNVPNYNLNISEEIFYTREKKESHIKKLIASDLSNFSIFTHTEKLNKILENVIEIVDGVDKIDSLTVSLKKIEKYNCATELNLNFKNFDIAVFNENLMLNIRNLSMFLKIDQVKFANDDITIAFAPFIMTISNPFDTNLVINNISSRLNFHEKSRSRLINGFFDKRSAKAANHSDNNLNATSHLNTLIFETNEFYYVSDIMLHSFKIEINESRTLSSIKINFGTTNLRVYDNHLMDVMSFLPTFLGFIFESGKRNRIRLFKNKPRPFKSNKQDKVLLLFENVNLVKIVDFNDIISCSFNDMELLADKHLRINRLTFYHRNPTNFLSKQKSKFLDIQTFLIKFNEGNVKISFDEIKVYYYCLELSFMIAKLSTYYQFFPEWLDYHLDWQFMIDDNKREKLIFENARITTVDIFFKFISIEIKENNIATCSLFDSDLQTLVMEKADNKTVKHALKTLKAIKKDYSSLLIVRNFDLRVYDYVDIKLKNYQDKVNFGENFSYYDTVYKTSEVNLFFREVSFLNHSKKILELKDLNLSIKDNKLFNNFNPNRVMSWILVQNNYFLHHRQVYKERVINSQIKIDIPNIFINLYNIKLFDRTIAFAFKSIKVISNFPFDIYVPNEYLEMKRITTYSRLTIIVENFIASINSLQEFENNLVAKMRKEGKKDDKEKEKEKAKLDLNAQKINLSNTKNLVQRRASKNELPPQQMTQITNPTQKIKLDFFDSQKNQEESGSELKLDLKISLCAIDLVNTPDSNSMEITCYSLKFGFDETQNVDGFPLMILPILEFNYDLDKNILRVNIPSKEMERKNPFVASDRINVNNADINNFHERNVSMIFNEQKRELQRFLHETKSFTLFIYYEYLEASTKIFENFLDRWNMTLKKYFKLEEKKIDNSENNFENADAINKNINLDNSVYLASKRDSNNRYVKKQDTPVQQEMNDIHVYKTATNLKQSNEPKINLKKDMLNNNNLNNMHNNNFLSLDNLNSLSNLNKINKGDSNLINSFNNNYNTKKNSLAIINDYQASNLKKDQSAFKTSKNLPAYLEKSNRILSTPEKTQTNKLTSVDEKISNLYKNTTNLKANTNNNYNPLVNLNNKDSIVNLGLEEKKPEALMENKYLKLKYGENIPKFKTNLNKKEEDKKEGDEYSMQLFVALFDLKIIYYVNYKKDKKEFESIFSLDTGTKQRDFFGYIIRIHSSSLSLKKTPGSELEESKDKLKVKMNLFSMSYLEQKNMNDDLYFHYDEDIAKYFRSKREIQALLNSKVNRNNRIDDDNENNFNVYNNIHNYNPYNNNSHSYNNAANNNNEGDNIDEFYKNIKIESEFLRFMELKKSFKYKYLNNITFDYFDIRKNKEEERKNIKHRNLSVESTNAIIKIINVNFKRISMKKSEDMLIKVNRFEILYNKYNKDLIQLIIFEDVLKIVDKIILKIDIEKESDEELNETLDAKSELSLKNEKSNNKIIPNLTLNKLETTKSNKQEGNIYILENNEAEGSQIRRKTNKSKKPKKQVQPQTILNTGLLKFYFSLRNPKIRIENEIRGSHIILVSEEECSVELSDICLDSAKKDFILNINLKKMNLLSYTKTVKHTNKIVESPEINFSILNRLESKFDKIESSNEISINVAKIRGFFQAKDFQDFYNILEILLYDRSESYAVEKKKIGDKIDVLKGKKKLSEIKALIERKTAGGENQFENSNAKILKKIKFNVNEVDLALKQDNETKIQLIITQFYGEQVIWDRKDRKSRSKVFLGDVKLISNLDDKYQNRYLLRKLETGRNTNSLNFPEIFSIPVMNLQPLISLEKQDKYIILEKEDLNLDKVTEWYYINDFKILLQPLSIDIHKSQIEFLLNFFKLNKPKEEEDSVAKAKKVENPEEEYPIYFKEVNVSPSEMKLNFNYAEESLMNIRNASIKIGTFLKANKFYSMQDLVDRFKSHCKLQLMKMIPDIVSSIFGTNVEQENANIEENNVRKALFGEK